MTTNANNLLMSGGIKAVVWPHLGATIVGTIIEDPKASQMTKFKSDELDFWPSGDPKMQIIVAIQTDQRDPANALDDGKRRLYITPRMMTPVREAVQRAGATGLAIGGRIAVKWVSGSGEGEGNARQFTAEYAAPALDPAGLLGTAPPPAEPPATTMLTAPAGPPAGVDPAKWATMPDSQRQAVLAAMSTDLSTHIPPF